MGIFNVLKKGAEIYANEIRKLSEQVEKEKEKMYTLSRDELIKEAKKEGNTQARKMAAMLVLKELYGKND
ncbi:hypothetical protein [Fusobacterium pseudoperiodonticum]|uniref:hypothetical protein n=1 Tax=Fusobacterium pseudoperiodonticum TaxID=2663009 RepID=UPI0028E24C1C|nr:hypothetical protein [Fusobacterium pseudoperiodonticum]